MNTNSVPALMSKNVGNTLTNYTAWNNVMFNVKSGKNGAKGDGSTDDTSAIQKTIDAAVAAGGGIVFFPAGNYLHSASFLLNGPVIIRGSGRNVTKLIRTVNSIDGFVVNANYVSIQDLNITSKAGLDISVVSAAIRAKSALNTVIEYCLLGDYYYGLWFETSTGLLTLRKCYVVNNYKYGIYFNQIDAPDGGDSTITDNVIDSALSTSDAGIRHEGGGGFRISNNKILGHKRGYDLQIRDADLTSILLITNNSIESQTFGAIRLGRSGTTGTFNQISITNNQTNVIVTPDASYTSVLVDYGVRDVTIEGNTFGGTGAHNGITLEGGDGINISGNALSTFSTAIKVNNSHSPTNVNIGSNTYRNVNTFMEDNTTTFNAPVVDYLYNRPLQVTSTTIYTNVFRIDMNQFRGGEIQFNVEGILAGVSGANRSIKKFISRVSGIIDVTAIRDIAVGSVIDVQFDFTTTTGSLYIGVRRNAAAGGTELDVNCTLMILGNVYRVARL